MRPSCSPHTSHSRVWGKRLRAHTGRGTSSMSRTFFRRTRLISASCATARSSRTSSTWNGVPPEKITVVPNWIDVDTWDRAEPTGAFRARYGLAGKFVILFAGILGPAQDIPFTLDVAARIRDIPDITFLLICDGTERSRAVAQAAAIGLSNVHFAPFVDPEAYPSLVKEMDVGL